MTNSNSNIGKTVIVVFILYLLGRFAGPFLFENNWSFGHFYFMPIYWQIGWIVSIPLLFFLVNRYTDRIGVVLQSKKAVWIGGIGLLVLLVLLRFDSFVYGDGNLLVNRIAIEKTGTFEWHETGSIGFVIILFKTIYALAGNFSEATPYRLSLMAGVNSIVLYSFICTSVSMIGAYKLSRLISSNRQDWWMSFLLIFLGPQMLTVFGYPGIEPAVVMFTIWVSYFILRLIEKKTIGDLGWLWVLQIIALFFSIVNFYLLPATIATTLLFFIREKKRSWLSYSTGGVVSVILIAILYSFVGSDFRLSQYILGLDGIMPHFDYRIFSLRHMADFMQLIWMLSPQILIIIALLIMRSDKDDSRTQSILLIMSATGIATIFLLNPVHSIPSDAPSFSVFLTPLAILLSLIVAKSGDITIGKGYRLSSIAVAFTLIVTFGLYPVYGSVDRSANQMEDYFDKHNHFYFAGSSTFRDSYFYHEDYTTADHWDLIPTSRSEEYINLRGCAELHSVGKTAEPLKQLPKIILQFPYWTAPRELLSEIHLNQGRLKLAKAQIDTCLLLEPRNIRHYQKAYLYHRDSREYPQALSIINEALKLSPDNSELLIDLMVGYQFSGKLREADSLANQIILIDPSQPFPHAIKGFIYEQKSDLKNAIASYEKFVKMAPEDIETPKIRKRLNALVLKYRAREKTH